MLHLFCKIKTEWFFQCLPHTFCIRLHQSFPPPPPPLFPPPPPVGPFFPSEIQKCHFSYSSFSSFSVFIHEISGYSFVNWITYFSLTCIWSEVTAPSRILLTGSSWGSYSGKFLGFFHIKKKKKNSDGHQTHFGLAKENDQQGVLELIPAVIRQEAGYTCTGHQLVTGLTQVCVSLEKRIPHIEHQHLKCLI